MWICDIWLIPDLINKVTVIANTNETISASRVKETNTDFLTASCNIHLIG